MNLTSFEFPELRETSPNACVKTAPFSSHHRTWEICSNKEAEINGHQRYSLMHSISFRGEERFTLCWLLLHSGQTRPKSGPTRPQTNKAWVKTNNDWVKANKDWVKRNKAWVKRNKARVKTNKAWVKTTIKPLHCLINDLCHLIHRYLAALTWHHRE